MLPHSWWMLHHLWWKSWIRDTLSLVPQFAIQIRFSTEPAPIYRWIQMRTPPLYENTRIDLNYKMRWSNGCDEKGSFTLFPLPPPSHFPLRRRDYSHLTLYPYLCQSYTSFSLHNGHCQNWWILISNSRSAGASPIGSRRRRRRSSATMIPEIGDDIVRLILQHSDWWCTCFFGLNTSKYNKIFV